MCQFWTNIPSSTFAAVNVEAVATPMEFITASKTVIMFLFFQLIIYDTKYAYDKILDRHVSLLLVIRRTVCARRVAFVNIAMGNFPKENCPSRQLLGTGFKSLTEAIDTTSPGGRMMMQIVGAFAEFERAMLRERTCHGLEAARKEGRLGGRRSKLTEKQKSEILISIQSGQKTAADAARLFNVHPATISRLLQQKNKPKQQFKQHNSILDGKFDAIRLFIRTKDRIMCL